MSGDRETTASPASGRAPRRRWVLPGLVTIVLVAVIAASSVLIQRATMDSGTETRMTHTITRGDLVVSVIEQGALESANNTEIKCKVRGYSTVTWVVDSGSVVQPGDELVRLDTKVIEETVSLSKTNVDLAKAKLERSSADFTRAEIAINAYLDGQYRSQLKSLEKDLVIAESNLLTARKMHDQSRSLFKRGYATDLEVEGHAFTVTQAELELKVRQTKIDVLERFTKAMEQESREGNLRAARSKREADRAELAMTTKRRSRALEELEACVVTAERDGLVIYPSAAKWKDTPDITEGATVRKDQVLLLMPDLSKMQVLVGIHESVVDRVEAGLTARVTLPGRTIEGEVSSVSTIANPAGWWTGNVVEYDAIVQLPPVEGLKPGMSAAIEVTMARHENVLMIPLTAVTETGKETFCWVGTPERAERRSLQLGDGNDVFVIVEAGLQEGDQVVLDPAVTIE